MPNESDPCAGLTDADLYLCRMTEILRQFAKGLGTAGKEALIASLKFPRDILKQTPEEGILLLAQKAQKQGHYFESAIISDALSRYLLQNPQQNTDLLAKSMLVQQKSLLQLRSQSDSTVLQAVHQESLGKQQIS